MKIYGNPTSAKTLLGLNIGFHWHHPTSFSTVVVQTDYAHPAVG